MGEVIKRTKEGRFLGWYLRYYDGGRRRQIASKQPTYAEARRMLQQIEAKIARGEAGIPERRAAWLTVAELAERFLSEYNRPRIKDIDSYRAQARTTLKNALPHVGKLPVDRIQRNDIAKLRDALARRKALGTVRNTMMILSAVFAWAVREGLAPANPCKGVEKPIAQHDPDYFTAAEVKALLACAADRSRSGRIADQLQHARVLLAVHTGMRKGELCGLRWRDLDLRSRRLTIARSYRTAPKSGKTRHIRLPDVAVPVLTEWAKVCPNTDEGLVFPFEGHRGWGMSTNTSDMLGLPALLEAAGCRQIAHCWHALRHTFASHFVMSGGNILTLQKILGHSDVKVTMIYAHLAPDFMGDELNRLKF